MYSHVVRIELGAASAAAVESTVKGANLYPKPDNFKLPPLTATYTLYFMIPAPLAFNSARRTLNPKPNT